LRFLTYKFSFHDCARKYIVAASVAFVTVLVYLPALQNEFVTWDDNLYVYDNPQIRSLGISLFKWAFLGFHVGNWHPLTWLSHALDYALWGLNPFGHHLTSVIFHGLNTFLVVILIIRLINYANPSTPPFTKGRHDSQPRGRGGIIKEGGYYTSIIAGAVTGLLFGLHPLHVESVAWVSERKDVLYAFFFLLSILAYIRYVKDSEGSAIIPRLLDRGYLTSLGLFVLSLLSKPMAVTLPAVLLIMDWYPFKRFKGTGNIRSVFIEKIPFFLLSLMSSVLTLLAQRSGDTIVSLETLPLSMRILVGFKALATYLSKMIWPNKLIPFYPFPRNVSLLSFEFLYPILLVTAITVACIALSRRHRLWLAIWSYYFVTLFPVLGIIQVGSQEMADRYTYMPSIGPFFLTGMGAAFVLDKLMRSERFRLHGKIVFFALLALLFSILSFITVSQIRIWKNGIVLWSCVIEIKPNISTAYNNRGGAYVELGQLEEALKDFTLAIQLSPNPSEAYFNRGSSYHLLGRYEEALIDLTLAIRMSPNYFEAYYNRGSSYLILGRYEEALKDFTEAIHLNSNPPFKYYNDRAVVYAKLGRYEEALKDYTQGINIYQNSPEPYYNRGNTYAKLGRYEEAIADYTQAIRLSTTPDFDYYKNRGIVYEKLGRHEESLKDLMQANSIGDNSSVARDSKPGKQQ
jgi:tetratricopeptide (TPR) repeat protein